MHLLHTKKQMGPQPPKYPQAQLHTPHLQQIVQPQQKSSEALDAHQYYRYSEKSPPGSRAHEFTPSRKLKHPTSKIGGSSFHVDQEDFNTLSSDKKLGSSLFMKYVKKKTDQEYQNL